jgi:CRP/FNR family cyclic AMP-dependent transcriptional regulator
MEDLQRRTRRLDLLRSIPLFADIPESKVESLLDDVRLREYAKDDIIFRQGDESREVYFVLKGKIRVFRISPAGEETSIDIFSTNDVIGEMAAIDYQPRSATAKAITKAALLTMSQEDFLRHVRTMPDLAFALARMLSQKLRWTAAFAESIAQFDAAGRLLHILLLYRERFGREVVPGKRYEIELELNQSDLASMVGARREWVNRLFSEWKRRGLVEFNRDVVTIVDLERVIAERDAHTEAVGDGELW